MQQGVVGLEVWSAGAVVAPLPMSTCGNGSKVRSRSGTSCKCSRTQDRGQIVFLEVGGQRSTSIAIRRSQLQKPTLAKGIGPKWPFIPEFLSASLARQVNMQNMYEFME